MYLFLLSFNVSIYTKERDIAIFVPLMKQRWQKHRHGIDVVPLVEYQATHGSLCLQYPRLIRVSFSYHSFLSFFHFLFTHTHPKKKRPYQLSLLLETVLLQWDVVQDLHLEMKLWRIQPEQQLLHWWSIGKVHQRIVSRICPLDQVYNGRVKGNM